jgi:hypothetical protein
MRREVVYHYGDSGGGERKKGPKEPQVIKVIDQILKLGRDWVDKQIGGSREYWTTEEIGQLKRGLICPAGVSSPEVADRFISFLWGKGKKQELSSLRFADRNSRTGERGTFEIKVSRDRVQVAPVEWGRVEAPLTGDERERVLEGLQDFLLIDSFQFRLQKQTEDEVWHYYKASEEFAGTLFDWVVDELYRKRLKRALSSDRRNYQAALRRWLPGVSVDWDRKSWGESLLVEWEGQEAIIPPRFRLEKKTRKRELSLEEGAGLIFVADSRGRFDVVGLRRGLRKGWFINQRFWESGGISLELSNEGTGETFLSIREEERGIYSLSTNHKLFGGRLILDCLQGKVNLVTNYLKRNPDIEDGGNYVTLSFREGMVFPWTEIEIDSCQGPIELSIRSGHQVFQGEEGLREIGVILPAKGLPRQSKLLEKAIFDPSILETFGSISIT